MKRIVLSLAILAACTLFIGCPVPVVPPDQGAATLVQPAGLPADTVADTVRSTESFDYKTLLTVTLNLSVDLYQKQISRIEKLPRGSSEVYVSLTNQSGKQVFGGKLLADGTLKASLQLPAAPESITLTLTSQGFAPRTVVIADMRKYSEINRTMGMLSSDSPLMNTTLPDSDSDGVPDAYDAAPLDPTYAFSLTVPADGNLTVAYEDLFGQAQAGDADYNDFVGAYKLTIKSNAENKVTGITGEAKAVTKLAGYDHRFGLFFNHFTGDAVLSVTYFDASGAQIASKCFEKKVNSRAEVVLFDHTKNCVGRTTKFSLTFATPQDPSAIDKPPYNPYLFVYNTGHDIHLIGEEPLPSSVNSADTYRDAEGFPWALLVPMDWINPLECQRIEIPYPRFTNWRLSMGTDFTDWYLHYNDPYVPPTPTPPPPPPTGPVKAYIAGSYLASTETACYWVDNADTRTDLFNTANAKANSIFVSGSDVYVAGHFTNVAFNQAASYWKNGSMTTLYSDVSGKGIAEASAIFVSGSDVYVSGYITSGTKSVGYWKNGQWVSLDTTTASNATDIFVSGTDVYVSGSYMSGVKNLACFWKNGVRTNLYTTDYSEASSITVAGSDVYLAGYFYNGLVNACYWKNNAASVTTLNSSVAFATDIALWGSTVYVSGYYNNTTGNQAACYWMDGAIVDLSLGLGASATSMASSIAVAGSDVYVAGYVDEGIQSACYWKNGTRVDLFTSGYSGASSVFLAY